MFFLKITFQSTCKSMNFVYDYGASGVVFLSEFCETVLLCVTEILHYFNFFSQMYNAPVPANYIPPESYQPMSAPPAAEQYPAPMPPSGERMNIFYYCQNLLELFL